MRHVIAAVLVLVAALMLAACASHKPVDPNAPVEVLMKTSRGDITLELYPDRAPITVANFLKYADKGDFDGTIIHRVVPGFVIQGGGWTPDLKERAKAAAAAGHPDTPIKNEWGPNGLRNERGTIAMAREEGPDTATREWFINLADNNRLDTPRAVSGNAGYAVFGRVVKGMDVVDAIAGVPTRARPETGVTDVSMNNVPEETILIKRVRRIAD